LDFRPALLLAAAGLSFSAVAADSQAPRITDVVFRDAVVDPRVAPGAFRLKVKFTDVGDDQTEATSSGLGSANFVLASPNGLQSVQAAPEFANKKATSGTVKVDMPGLGLYAEAGQWTFRYASITDLAGNTRVYSFLNPVPASGGIAPVVNETSDAGLPQLLQMKVKTSTVVTDETSTAKGSFKVQLSDDVSGAASLLILFYSESGAQRYVDVDLPTHDLEGKYELPFQLDDVGVDTGVWSLGETLLCDVVGNCSVYTRNQLVEMNGEDALGFEVVE